MAKMQDDVVVVPEGFSQVRTANGVQACGLSKCSACGRPIFWATTQGGKKMPLDPQPQTKIVVVRREDLRGQAVDAYTVQAFTPHHATCPKAQDFRK
jgi:hypothetical protein